MVRRYVAIEGYTVDAVYELRWEYQLPLHGNRVGILTMEGASILAAHLNSVFPPMLGYKGVCIYNDGEIVVFLRQMDLGLAEVAGEDHPVTLIVGRDAVPNGDGGSVQVPFDLSTPQFMFKVAPGYRMETHGKGEKAVTGFTLK